MRKLAIAAGVALLAAACDGGGGAVMAACMETSEFNRATCDCIADRAAADLTGAQRATLVSAMNEESGIDDLPISEQMQLATFMADAGMSCAVEHAD
jgi:hypothetical protein